MKNILIAGVVAYALYAFLTYGGNRSPILSYESDIVPGAEIIMQNLHVPWSVDFLPDNRILIAERNGILRIMGEDRFINVPGVVEKGEGGLLGVAVHPNFEENNYIYLYFTSEINGKTINRVVRYLFVDGNIIENRIIVDSIPGGAVHNGGRIAFGPDNMLYITTGDAGDSKLAQDISSLAGKILRMNEDGSIPKSNPFNNTVYSYGHRNPQGITWDSRGRMWETEHGRSGFQSGYDEINLIERGSNYGWPEIQGNQSKEGMLRPVLHSGSKVTWAPSGLAYKNGNLYFAGLRGSALYQVEVTEKGLGTLKENFKNEFGRLREVKVGPENTLYVTTSNRDGRGEIREGDDKLLEIVI